MKVTNTPILLLFTFIFCLFSCPMTFANHFAYNANCAEAYRHILSLRLEQGSQLIAQEKNTHPENDMVILLENYIDFLKVFVLEEETLLYKLQDNKEQRLKQLDKSDKNSPYYRYSKAEINLQSALARLKFGENMKATLEIRRGFKLLEENQRKFPDFYPNKKTLGLMHALIGTIPDKYQWGVKMLGLHGSIDQGMREMESFLNYSRQNAHHFYEEAQIIYTFLLLHLKEDKQKAWERAKNLPIENNLMNVFIASDIAFRTGHNDAGIRMLENRPKSNAYLPFHFLDYYLGVLKLHRLDKDADVPIHRFLKNFKGKHYIKEAYYKLAWHALLQNDLAKYAHFLQLCKTKGNQLSDPDKKAYKAANLGITPHQEILKSRLLFDGGYYEQALEVLNAQTVANFSNAQDRLEFIYRYGRTYECMGNWSKAIDYYQQTIRDSENTNFYFAPKACLQLGKIYEQKGNTYAAIYYFQQCIDYRGHDYEDSLEHQAKAGLNRVGE